MKDFINGGFMVFNKKIFDYLSTDENCTLEKEPLKQLANNKQLAGYVHKGFWKCMDTQKDLDELNKIYNESQVNSGAPWEIWKKKNKMKNNNSNILEETPSYKRILSFPERRGFWNENENSDKLNNFNKNESRILE